MSSKPILVKVDEETYKTLKKIKERDGVPMIETVKRAVAKYVYGKNKGV